MCGAEKCRPQLETYTKVVAAFGVFGRVWRAFGLLTGSRLELLALDC